MMLDAGILSGSCQLAKAQSALAASLAPFSGRKISIYGAGKNGRLLAGLFLAANIPLYKIYDDNPIGLPGMIPVELPPKKFQDNEVVCISLAPKNPHFNTVLEKLRRRNVEMLTFASSSPPKQNHSPVQGSHDPLAHVLHDEKYAKFVDPRMQRFHNKHRGARCIIIGNGPSLNQTDLSQLNGEITFGLNKIYLLFKKSNFRPTYICGYIKDVVNQCREEYIRLTDIPIFISHESLDLIPPEYDHIHYFGPHKSLRFSTNPDREVCCGFTVTYVAMQLAFFMGFTHVILVGVDHNFNYDGPPDKWQKIDKPRSTHFDPHYFDTGENWQTPNFKMIEAHYAFAKAAYEHHGRIIIDATVNGKLMVFDTMSLGDALALPMPNLNMSQR